MIYSCQYYAVSFFVFVKLCDSGSWEPILEADDECHGHELIRWLEHNPFITRQLLEAANDNPGMADPDTLPANLLPH